MQTKKDGRSILEKLKDELDKTNKILMMLRNRFHELQDIIENKKFHGLATQTKLNQLNQNMDLACKISEIYEDYKMNLVEQLRRY